MTVFKAFWSIVWRYKAMILLYTILLILFGGINTTTNSNGIDFTDSKPDVFLILEDEYTGLTKNLVDYIKENTNVISPDEILDIDDALFYREINYVITIPKGYRFSTLHFQSPSLHVKSTGDYQASLAEMILSRYLKTQDILLSSFQNEEELIVQINENLDTKTNISVASKLDTQTLNQVTQYFNFASYSLMAVIIFIISLVLSSFHEGKISKRIRVSSMKYKTHQRHVLMASFLYIMIAFVLFCVLAFCLFGNILLQVRGYLYFFNTFVFSFVSLAIALLIVNLVVNKEAVSGIVNVVALGSAFLCGAFVPMEWMPKSVLTLAHFLPSYWYIQVNELLKVTEEFSFETLLPIFQNILVLFVFGIFFLLLNQLVFRIKQKRKV